MSHWLLFCLTMWIWIQSILPHHLFPVLTTCRAAEAYRLGAGDMVAVIVHGVVGKFGKAPVHFPKEGEDFSPVMGFPYPVLDDGHLHLPLVEPIDVNGMTVAEAQRFVSAAYMEADVQTRPNMVALTLMRKRQIHVTVIHNAPYRGHASIDKVKLSADQATLLGAVAEAGTFDRHSSVRVLSPGSGITAGGQAANHTSRLSDGAVVEMRSPPRHYYFTGGLVAGGQYSLPFSGGFNALQAIAAAGGVRQQGLLPPHQLTVLSRTGPTVTLPLSHVLANPNGVLVQPGDTLIVR